MKRLLITGGGGFIGRAVLPLLRSADFEVAGVGRREPGEEWTKDDRYLQCDLLAPGEAERAVQELQPTHLLHLAWNVTPGKYWTSPENLDWVAASLQLWRAFALQGGVRGVFAGTCAEYDWSPESTSKPLSETTTPIAPRSLYGKSKAALQQLVCSSAKELGVSAAWGRIFFLYGEHEPRGRLVSDIINSLLRGEPAPCTHGRQERDFMHVSDVAKAFVMLLESNLEGPVNIASGECIPVRQVVDTIGEMAGRSDLIQYGAKETASDEPGRIVGEVSLLNAAVQFVPQASLKQGIHRSVSWWRSTNECTE